MGLQPIYGRLLLVVISLWLGCFLPLQTSDAQDASPFTVIHDISWSPQGNQFVYSDEFGAHFYSAESVLQFSIDLPNPSQVAWSPDGSKIGIVSEQGLLIQDLLRETSWQMGEYVKLAWHDSGELIAVMDPDGRIILYDLITNTIRASYDDREIIRTLHPILTWKEDTLLLLSSTHVYQWMPFFDGSIKRWELPFLANWDHYWESPWNHNADQLILTPLAIEGPTYDQIGLWNIESKETHWGNFHNLFYTTYGIAWSPDDRYLAVATYSDLYVLEPDHFGVVWRYPFSYSEYSLIVGDTACLEHPDYPHIDNHVIWHPSGDHILVANACRLLDISVFEKLTSSPIDDRD